MLLAHMSNNHSAEDFSYVSNIMGGTRKEVYRVVTERNFALLVNEVVQMLAEENKSLRTENDMLRERLNLAAISDYRISEKHRRALLSQGLAENQLRMPALIEMVAKYASRFVQSRSQQLKQNEGPTPEQAPSAPSGISIAPQRRQILASFIERYSNPMIETTTSTTSILTAAQVNDAGQVSRPVAIDQLSKTNDQFERVRQSKTSRQPNDVNRDLCPKPIPTADIRLQHSRNSRLPGISGGDDIRRDLHPEHSPTTDIRSRPNRNRRETEIERTSDVTRDSRPELVPIADICLRQSRNSRQPEISCVNDKRDLRPETLPAADIRPFKSVPVKENRLPSTSLEHTDNGCGYALLRQHSRSSRSPPWKAPRSQMLQWESDSEEMDDQRKRIRRNLAGCQDRMNPLYQRLRQY